MWPALNVTHAQTRASTLRDSDANAANEHWHAIGITSILKK
jgi:hypothetical protein